MPDFGSFGTEGGMPDFGSFGTDGSMPSIGSSDTGSTAPSFDFSNMFGGSGGFGGMSFGMGSGDVKLQYIDDNPSSYSSIFGNAKTDVTDADMDRLIESLKLLSEGKNIEKVVDVDEVLRYFVVHNFVCNGDSYTGSIIHNYYLYEENGQMSMIPWDYNLAFGTFQGNDASGQVNDPIDSPMSVSGSDRPMIDWIWSSEEYRSMYHSYFAEFLDTVDIVGMIDHAHALIKPYVEKDPGKFCTTEAFELGVSTLREFCTLREESVRGQLAGTIPSTDAGQQQDRSALVDASHLNLSAMGSMGGGMGGMGGRGENSRPESGEGSENTFRPGRTPTSDKSNVPPASPENSATSAPQMTPTSAIGSGSAFPSALNGSVIGLAAETTANQNIPQMPSGMTPPTGEMPSGMTPPTGEMPSGMTPPTGEMPSGMTPPTGEMPSGMTPPTGEMPSGMTPPTGEMPSGSIPADGEMPGGGSFPNFGSMPSESMPANGDGSFPSEGSFPNMGQIPGFSSGEQGSGSQRPSGMGSFGESNFGGAGYGNAMTGNNTTMLLAVSVIVLAVGLLVAFLFKPRSW